MLSLNVSKDKKKKKTLSSILSEKIKSIESRLKDIESTVVDAVIELVDSPIPKKGDPGESVKGDPGESIKGDPGKRGKRGFPGESIKGDPGESIKGDPGESIKGDPGKEGIGFTDAEIDKKGDLILQRTDNVKINAGRIKQNVIERIIHGTGGGGGGGVKQKLFQIGDLLGFNGSETRISIGATPDGYVLTSDSTDPFGVRWKKSSQQIEIDFTNQTSVNVTHDFGAKPVVQIVDTNGFLFGPFNLQHISADTFIVSLDPVSSGTIIMTFGNPRSTEDSLPSTEEIDFSFSPYSSTLTEGGADKIINADATDGNIIILLPTIVGNLNRHLIFRKADSSVNTVTITAQSGEFINGESTFELTDQYETVRLNVLTAEWGEIN